MDESIQRKQKLAQMLIDANEVREQYIMEKLPTRKVLAAEKNCAQLIASLIEEGLPYEYNESDTGDGLISIVIDDERISCKNDDIYEFLGEMYEPIMKKSYEALTGKSIKVEETASSQAPYPTQPYPNQPYAPIIIQTTEPTPAAAPTPPPVQEYVPPKIYLNEEDEYQQLKKKHASKPHGSKGLLKTLIVLIIIGLIFVLYFYNTGFHDFINNIWDKLSSSFSKEEATTAIESLPV